MATATTMKAMRSNESAAAMTRRPMLATDQKKGTEMRQYRVAMLV